MLELKIFLGSPLDVKDERIFVGSIIQTLNDKYEPLGMRIYLYMWEDFPVEYKGISKQEEYNKYLVSKSNIAVFLFKDTIGESTLDEYKVAKENKLDIHVFLLPQYSKEIKDYLQDNEIEFIELESEDKLNEKLLEISENYYSGKCDRKEIPSERVKYKFYVTYGCDLNIVDEHMFSNIIRYLDDFLDKGFNKGCSIHPKNKSNLLKESDYYAAFFKSKSDENNENDFREALNVLNNSRLRYITVFQKSYNDTTPIHKEESYIGNILKTNQIFTTGANKNNIRLILLLRLFDWEGALLKNDHLKIEGNLIFLFDQYITSINELNLSDELKNLPYEIKSATKKYEANIRKYTIKEKMYYSEKIKQKEERLKKGVFSELSRILSSSDGNNVVDYEHYSINISERERQLNFEIECLTDDISDKIVRWKKDLEEYKNIISVLMKRLNTGDKIDINRYLKLCDETISAIYEMNIDEKEFIADYYMSIVEMFKDPTLFLDTMLIDLYKNAYSYLKLLENPSINNLLVMQDYTYFLKNNGKNEEVVEVYKTICDKLSKIDDSKKIYRYIITRIYTRYVHFYMDRIRHQSQILTDILNDFEKKLNNWKAKGWEIYEVETFLLSAKLKNSPIIDHIDPSSTNFKEQLYLLNQSEELFNTIIGSRISVDKDNHWDVFCYFPHTIASFYLDRFNYFYNQHYKKFEEKFFYYENYVLEQLKFYDSRDEIIGFESYVYHNMGYFYSKLFTITNRVPYYNRALYNYKKALEYRRELVSHIKGDDLKQVLIIETLVNINGLMQKPNSLIINGDYKYALDIVNELYNLTKRLKSQSLYSDEDYYKAVLAYCTMHYKLGLNNVDRTISKEESLKLLNECYEWSIKNSELYYAGIIKSEYDNIMENECNK